jgi:hypothetical protein
MSSNNLKKSARQKREPAYEKWVNDYIELEAALEADQKQKEINSLYGGNL